jgi:hypothetical protein
LAQRENGHEIGTWNVRSLYRSGSLKTIARELGKYKLDLVGVQEVRWRIAANILNKQSRTADSGWSSCLRVGRGANNPPP